MTRNALAPYLTDMGGYDQEQIPAQYMQPELRAYRPTWRDTLASWLMPDERASPEQSRLVEGLTGSRGLGNTGMGIVDFVPGVGNAFQAQEEGRKGEGANMMFAMVGGPAAKVPKPGPQLSTGNALSPPGIRAYHGSPHDFDRFDMSKIGTGEGAQAYGHGMYFAESEGVAKSYRNALGSQRMKDGTPFDERNPAHWAADAVERAGGDKSKAAQLLASEMTPDMKATDGGHYQRLLRAKGMIERGEAIPEIGAGRLYEVRINASPDDFLDWDKPLSAQSEKVRGALQTVGIGAEDAPHHTVHKNQYSEGYTVRLPDGRGGPSFRTQAEAEERAAEMNRVLVQDKSMRNLATPENTNRLRDAGIPGIKYLDQGSRASGEGSRNYVVFRDDIIDIVRKYGIAAAVSMYGMDQVSQAMSTGNVPDQNALAQ